MISYSKKKFLGNSVLYFLFFSNQFTFLPVSVLFFFNSLFIQRFFLIYFSLFISYFHLYYYKYVSRVSFLYFMICTYFFCIHKIAHMLMHCTLQNYNYKSRPHITCNRFNMFSWFTKSLLTDWSGFE